MNSRQSLSEILTPSTLKRRSTVIYGLMTVVSLLIMHFSHKSLQVALGWPKAPLEIGRLLTIGWLGAVVLLVLSYFFEDWFAAFRDLKAMVMRFLGPCSVLTALYLSVITAFGEELLFRGVLLPFCGLFFSSLLFGLLHMGKDGFISAWSIWAFIAGLLLGWIFQQSGSLWPPIIAHFGVNAVSILNLRRIYRAWVRHQSQLLAENSDSVVKSHDLGGGAP